MKIRVYPSLVAKRLLLGFTFLILPLLLLSNQTQAKNLRSLADKPAVAVVSIADLPGLNIRNGAEVKARLLHLAAHNPKAIKVIAKGCGCPAGTPTGMGGFGTCMKACMADVGVSPYALIMCGVACAAAETGIGAVVCAVCLGVSVTVIEVCAMGCAIEGMGGGHIGGLMEARNTRRRHTTSGTLQAQLRLQPVKSGV